MAIEAPHYAECRDALANSAIVRRLFEELDDEFQAALATSIPSGFHQAANAEYARRGGTITDRHIGAVAEALQILAQGVVR